MGRKSILILGDDPQIVRACADLDIGLTVVCGLPNKDFGLPSTLDPDRMVFVEDASNVESVILGLRRAGTNVADFDAVYSTEESGVVTAAALGKVFGVPSLPAEVAALFRDKSLAKSALRAVGIRTAEFIVIDDLCDLPADFSVPFETAVLKPVAGGATWYTTMIRNERDLQAAVDRVRERRQFRTFILEEFVPGQEWHVDGVMFRGELQFISVGGYRRTCLETISSQEWLCTFLYDPTDDANVYDLVTPFVERALTTLGLSDGVFHMEVFYDADSGHLAFGECAARRGGGLVEEEIRRKFGISLAEAAAHCALGMPPVVKPEIRPGVVGAVYLPYSPGALIRMPTAREVVGLPGVEYAVVELPVGFTMSSMKNTLHKAGMALLSAESREQLFARADEVITWFTERTHIAPPNATARQLREIAMNVPGTAVPHLAWADKERS
ncbi:acetyl-CoA carboxylase biotin carboxylase subunit family protein [Streptomyces sp. NPDC056661]|uniref:ATP-grasp domain-containing protein n=1 Tax=Streptomyces sp. NPDC056661 TaxID=3345898 RepID=UPI003689D2CA